MDSQQPHIENWTIKDGKLHAEYTFKDFKEAMSFMQKVAVIADQLDHHPDWSNSYNKVQIDLVTHSKDNTISDLDYSLAKEINKITQEYILL